MAPLLYVFVCMYLLSMCLETPITVNLCATSAGVSKAPCVDFLVSRVRSRKISFRLFQSHEYLTGATAAEQTCVCSEC